MKLSNVFWLIVFSLSYLEQELISAKQAFCFLPFQCSEINYENHAYISYVHERQEIEGFFKNSLKTKGDWKFLISSHEVNSWETIICCGIGKILENWYN